MKLSTTFILFLLLSSLLISCQSNTSSFSSGSPLGWEQLTKIKNKINPPVFPEKDFSIMDYGAGTDSTKDCLPAIEKAITACHQAGGGRVIIPSGVYFVKGPIHLKTNVNLHISAGAILRFSTEPADYLPLVRTRFEGIELMNYSPLIYAYKQKNIAVTGKGILDGQADNGHWWSWKGIKRYGWKQGMPSQLDSANRPELARMAAENIPVEERKFGKGHYLRPAFLEVNHCKNVLIRGITLRHSPFWILHPTLSQNITIDGVTTLSYGPNNDGCDPESCTNIMIKNCHFSNGDDCIAIKSGRDEDGRRIDIPTKNIVIENCYMEDGHGGVVVGSETSGGVENLFVQNCKMNSPHLARAIRIKSNACRGGVLKNFYFRNIEVGEVGEAVIKINMFYGNENMEGCHYPPTLDSVFISHITSQKSKYAINIQGRKDKPIEHIRISDCDFEQVGEKNIIKEIKDLTLSNTTINGEEVHWGK